MKTLTGLILCLFIASSMCGDVDPDGTYSGVNIKAIRGWVVSNRDKFDPQDVANILHGADWHITRYIDDLSDGENDVKLVDVKKMMGENLLWRASMKLNSWKPEDFACEFWLAGFLQLTHDRDDAPVLAADVRVLGSYSGGLRTEWYAFQHFQINIVDQLAGRNGTGWSFIDSMSGVHIGNFADLSGIIKHFANMVDYYPGLLMGNYVVDMPPLMVTATRMLMKVFSARTRDMMKFLEDHERFFLVKKRDMPEHFGGRLPVSKGLMMVQFPKLLTDCVPLRDMAQQKGWSDQSVKEFLDNTKHIIDYNARQLNIRKLL